MAEQDTSGAAGRAYHLKRADQEIGRAENATESGARHAHRTLAQLHRARAVDGGPTGLHTVME